jgi:hypothetical protein
MFENPSIVRGFLFYDIFIYKNYTMSKRLIISEDEKNEIRNKYSVVQEQITGGNTTGQDDKITTQLVDRTKKLRGGLFKTGSDQVDTSSPEFQQAVKDLTAVGNIGNPVEIIGGASSVGADRGFDNKGLATRRALNFKKALKDAGVNTDRMFVTNVVVGNATERNSPDALQQQYVGYTVRDTDYKIDYQTAIDNTATVRQDIKRPLNLTQTYPEPKPKKDEKGKYFDLRVHYRGDNNTAIKLTSAMMKSIDGNTSVIKVQGL